jgi:hypothetical protein
MARRVRFTHLPVRYTTSDATPCSAALLYFILMIWIVVRRLREQRPFVFYVLAGVLFVLAQLAYFLLSRPICSGTNAKIDGSFLATALETATVIVLYLAWQGITEGLSISRRVYSRCAHHHWQTTGVRMCTFHEWRELFLLYDTRFCVYITISVMIFPPLRLVVHFPFSASGPHRDPCQVSFQFSRLLVRKGQA